MERKVKVAIIGAGSAGLNALSRVRKVLDREEYVLINGGELGTTCARVGCMPSKVAIQVAEDFYRRHYFDRVGIEGDESLAINVADAMEHVRDLRDIFVDRVLSGSTDNMGDELIDGYAHFIEPGLLQVGEDTVRADRVIIATGSRPFVPAPWEAFRDRVITTDELFEQEDLPASMAVVGLGVIGLEMGQALHRMGIEVTGFDQLDTIGGLQDPVVSRSAVSLLGKEFPLHLGQRAEVTQEADGRLRVTAGEHSVVVDKVLASLGRVPNLETLGLENLGAALDKRGVPLHDSSTMQIGDLPVFIAGDVSGDRAILHEAGDEGRIAGFNAVSDNITAFRRKTPLAVTFCDPNIATVGVPWPQLDPAQTEVGEIQFGPVGRALIMGKNKGVLRIYGDRATGRLLGGAMVAPKGENLAHLLAWAVQQELTVFDLLKMPFYHPAIEEALQAALYDLMGKVEASGEAMVELRPA